MDGLMTVWRGLALYFSLSRLGEMVSLCPGGVCQE